jgi:hypothetical protein
MMTGTIEEYQRLFREATVSDQMKLFRLHVAIYLVVNIIYYSPVGWGLLIIVHYWFYVRGAENLCKLREETVAAKIK